MRISFTDLMNEEKRGGRPKGLPPFMMDEIRVTAGDRCVEGCALDKPSEEGDGSERATIETEPKKRNPLWDSSLYAKHLSLWFMFHIRF